MYKLYMRLSHRLMAVSSNFAVLANPKRLTYGTIVTGGAVTCVQSPWRPFQRAVSLRLSVVPDNNSIETQHNSPRHISSQHTSSQHNSHHHNSPRHNSPQPQLITTQLTTTQLITTTITRCKDLMHLRRDAAYLASAPTLHHLLGLARTIHTYVQSTCRIPAGKSSFIWSYAVCVHGPGQSLSLCTLWAY